MAWGTLVTKTLWFCILTPVSGFCMSFTSASICKTQQEEPAEREIHSRSFSQHEQSPEAQRRPELHVCSVNRCLPSQKAIKAWILTQEMCRGSRSHKKDSDGQRGERPGQEAMPCDSGRQRTEGDEVLLDVGMAGGGQVLMGFICHP